jgi:hypothetical protein
LSGVQAAFDIESRPVRDARNQPLAAAGALLIALDGWVAYLNTCRRLSMTGMQPP